MGKHCVKIWKTDDNGDKIWVENPNECKKYTEDVCVDEKMSRPVVKYERQCTQRTKTHYKRNHISITSYESNFARQHNICSSFKSIRQRFPATIQVMNSSGGFFRQTLNSRQELWIFLMD